MQKESISKLERKLSLKKKFGIYLHYLFFQEKTNCLKGNTSKFARLKYQIYFSLKNPRKVIELFNNKYVVMHYVEQVITTYCSLRCKNCGNFIPYYKKPYHVSLDTNLLAIDRLLSGVDQINIYRVLGGEPLLYPDLGGVLNKLIESKKIKHIEVVTNGTIIPSVELIKLLSNEKVSVWISNYGTASTKINKLQELFNKEHIQYYLPEPDAFWLDHGGLERRNKSIKEVKDQFKSCHIACFSYLNGKLHRCPRSSNGMDAGIVPDKKSDYINLFDDSMDNNQIRMSLNDFIWGDTLTYLEACYYCDRGTKDCKHVTPGIQL